MKGSMARAETEELAGRPVFIALQVLPVSVLLNTPPPSCAPAYSVLGVRGSMASAPMAAVAGPWLVQALMPACTECALATESTAQISAGARRMPRAPDILRIRSRSHLSVRHDQPGVVGNHGGTGRLRELDVSLVEELSSLDLISEVHLARDAGKVSGTTHKRVFA